MTDHNARQAGIAEALHYLQMGIANLELGNGVHMIDFRNAERAILAALAPFQERVHPWMLECFGAEIASDRIERNHRFFEEATELVQSNGMTRSEAHQLVDYTFDRPVGDLHQEVGGVMVTLAALCLASGADMHAAGESELARIWTKVEQIRAKQAAKPKHSPLPAVPAPAAQADERTSVQYLCKAWGETDLPAVAIVTGLDGVRAFLVAEWLGSADDTQDDGTNSLDDALQDMQEQWQLEGEAWEWSIRFEIGGISVQKVFSAARQQSATPAAPVQSGESYRARSARLSAGRITWQERAAIELMYATPAECTCPSGHGSLRHPCPVHSGEPVAWLRDDGDDVITSAKKTSLELTNGLPGARVAGTYNTPLYRATPVDAASEADKRDAERWRELKLHTHETELKRGCTASEYGQANWLLNYATMDDLLDLYIERRRCSTTDAAVQRERQQGAGAAMSNQAQKGGES